MQGGPCGLASFPSQLPAMSRGGGQVEFGSTVQFYSPAVSSPSPWGSNVTPRSTADCPEIKAQGAEENTHPDKKLPTGTRLPLSQAQVLIPGTRQRQDPAEAVLISN